ncbi:MAG: hypothetical protein IT578_00895 [Verrucomicrobiae bacterium]|nr:hypothetical protein [Verrucomicrobiae bacterium]
MKDCLRFLADQFRSHAALDADVLREKLPALAAGWSRADGVAPSLYRRSGQTDGETLFFLVRQGAERRLSAVGPAAELAAFEGERVELGGGRSVGVFPLSAGNAAALRARFAWLSPRVYDLAPTFGCGDRLGLATPGHLRAARACGVNVLVAQQSIREMARTGRTAQDVMDDAMWGVFQEGYTEGFGADADHLKTFQDIETTAAAGFTMFTLDPSEYVDRTADAASEAVLDAKLAESDSAELPVPTADLMARYAERSFAVEGLDRLEPTAIEIKRAIVKYGRAIAHTERLARHVAHVLGSRPYDLEMSVDETDNPTTLVEHFFVGSELKRRGIAVQSLALRFVGEFQKGVDYVGDLSVFEKSFKDLFAVARHCGPYKMSIHSGSDKFSIFPIIGRIAGDLVHEKTAGTSYLEALRVAARVDAKLFREIWAFALERFPTDRATYHVVEKLTTLPDLKAFPDAKLESLFDNNDGRQLLHVTFGSVLNEKDASGALRFKDRFFKMLKEHEDTYAQVLEAHFVRHMESLGMARKR